MSDLQKKKKKLEIEKDELREKWLDAEKRHDAEAMEEYDNQIQIKFRILSWLETEEIKAKAQKYGIVIPRDNKGWWWSDPDFKGDPFDAPDMLTGIGKAGALKLIKDEQRANNDWLVKNISLIITILTGFGGMVIGILAIYYSQTDNQKKCADPTAVIEPATNPTTNK